MHAYGSYSPKYLITVGRVALFGFLDLYLDGASNPGKRKTDEGGSRTSKRRDGTKTFPAAGRGTTGQRGTGESFILDVT